MIFHKIIIFDMDGVLVDLKEMHALAFLSSIKEVCGWTLSLGEHNKSLCGLPTKEKLKRLGIEPERAEKISKLKQEKTLSAISELGEDKNLQEILKNLRSSGYILYVASNSLRETVEIVLKRLGIIKYFTAYFGNDDVKTGKPSPELYWKCINYLYKYDNKDTCLVIEDSPVGQRAIETGGFHGLIVKDRSDLTLEKIMNRLGEICLM